MVMVSRRRTDNTIAKTKRTNDVVHRDTRVTVPLYNCICIKYVVLILFVYFYLLVPLISIPCFVKMYVFIAPVTQLAAAECIFE